MSSRFSRHIHLTSRALSGLLVGGVLGVMLAVALLARMDALSVGSEQPSTTASSADPVVQQAIEQHRCSTRGFESGTIPSSALIKTGAGDLLLVSFDRGWKIHERAHDPATLVAVCLEDLPPGTTQKRP